MAVPETERQTDVNSMDQLIGELLQLVGEILLFRRPRVHTASAPEPEPQRRRPVVNNFYRSIVGAGDHCPFCAGGKVKKNSRLLY